MASESADGQSIAVYVRVRQQEGRKSLTTHPELGQIVLHTGSTSEDRTFSFDMVGGEDTAQEEVFEAVGRPLSDACISGYNTTIFAYGQTGAGKVRHLAPRATRLAAAPNPHKIAPLISAVPCLLPCCADVYHVRSAIRCPIGSCDRQRCSRCRCHRPYSLIVPWPDTARALPCFRADGARGAHVGGQPHIPLHRLAPRDLQ